MDYRKYGGRYLVRLDKGEELLSCVKRIAESEQIRLGEFRGLGAADDLELGVYDVAQQVYFKSQYTGAYEITSLFGTISEKDGEVYLHAHLSASSADGNSVGGHLNRAVISGTCEMVIEPMEGHAGRKRNEATGLFDLDFSA